MKEVKIAANDDGKITYYYVQPEFSPIDFSQFSGLEKETIAFVQSDIWLIKKEVENDKKIEDKDRVLEEKVRSMVSDWEITEKPISKLNEYLSIGSDTAYKVDWKTD